MPLFISMAKKAEAFLTGHCRSVADVPAFHVSVFAIVQVEWHWLPKSRPVFLRDTGVASAAMSKNQYSLFQQFVSPGTCAEEQD